MCLSNFYFKHILHRQCILCSIFLHCCALLLIWSFVHYILLFLERNCNGIFLSGDCLFHVIFILLILLNTALNHWCMITTHSGLRALHDWAQPCVMQQKLIVCWSLLWACVPFSVYYVFNFAALMYFVPDLIIYVLLFLEWNCNVYFAFWSLLSHVTFILLILLNTALSHWGMKTTHSWWTSSICWHSCIIVMRNIYDFLMQWSRSPRMTQESPVSSQLFLDTSLGWHTLSVRLTNQDQVSI